MSTFLNISTDTTLGGNSPSDLAVSSQKAIKTYVDNKTGTAPAFADITGQPTDNANLATALNAKQATLVSGTNIKTINNTSLLGSGNIAVDNLDYYGTCSTGASTQAKVVVCDGFVLKTGASIRVKFSNNQTYNGGVSLNVNSTGAIAVKSVGTTNNVRYCWLAGEVVSFTYDGSYWIMEDAGIATTSYYGYTKLTSTYTASDSTLAVTGVAVKNAIATKQNTLVSGTNIKTINGNSLLGSGNITIETSSTPNVDGTTISYNSSDALQTIAVKNKRDNSTLPIWQGTETQWNQGEATPWYYWQTDAVPLATNSSMPSGGDNILGYGNGVLVTANSKATYSTNSGTSWSGSNLPVSGPWIGITYGGGVFVAVSSSGNNVIYSTDGISWSNTTLSNSGLWKKPAYGDNVFITIASNIGIAEYSTDGGETWSSSNLPVSGSSDGLIYGNGIFLTIITNSNGNDNAVYSTDGGETWSSSSLSSSGIFYKLSYGNGVFVAIPTTGNTAMYSTDYGLTWNSSTLPSINSGNWNSVGYGDGKFVAVSTGTEKKGAYSTDNGVTWNSSTLPSKGNWGWITYGDGVFVANRTSSYSPRGVFVAYGNGVSWQEIDFNSDAYNSCGNIIYDNGSFFFISYDRDSREFEFHTFSISFTKCYTDTANPTTSSTVYSAPAVTSSYTISSLTSGAITLSDNNTYYYNQSGNQYTYQPVGTAHPDWLCFINGVGVKIGNTTIATA